MRELLRTLRTLFSSNAKTGGTTLKADASLMHRAKLEREVLSESAIPSWRLRACDPADCVVHFVHPIWIVLSGIEGCQASKAGTPALR